jgi:hypothetical protein
MLAALVDRDALSAIAEDGFFGLHLAIATRPAAEADADGLFLLRANTDYRWLKPFLSTVAPTLPRRSRKSSIYFNRLTAFESSSR